MPYRLLIIELPHPAPASPTLPWLTETSLALGQTPSPTLVGEVTGSVPGVLIGGTKSPGPSILRAEAAASARIGRSSLSL
jgi:hypothetical protein